MQVHEERLRDVRGGRWSPDALRRHNPLILEAVQELTADSPWSDRARRAAGLFAATLGLGDSEGPRVGVTVAARALDDVLRAEPTDAYRELRRLGEQCPLYGLVCDELVGHRVHGERRSSGERRSEEERRTVTRALYLVARMVSSQEQVAELEELVQASSDGPGG